jgi:hypothetical protein
LAYKYVCVEVGQIGDAVKLGADSTWKASQTLVVPGKVEADEESKAEGTKGMDGRAEPQPKKRCLIL